MPQGRIKIGISGKAKKQQVQTKKQAKDMSMIPQTVTHDEASSYSAYDSLVNVQELIKCGCGNVDSYALQFLRESEAEIKAREMNGRQELKKRLLKDLEINGSEYFEGFDFPKIPYYNKDISVNTQEKNEQIYFTEYVKTLERNNKEKALSYFELNLEIWRQLWRVLEISDVILFIVDIRFSSLMFPPSLYKYVTGTLKKQMILVINKIDLVDAATVVAWKHYFQEMYPELYIVPFTSYPKYKLIGKTSNKFKGIRRIPREGAQSLLKACKQIVSNEVDLTSWENKIREEMSYENESDEGEFSQTTLQEEDAGYFEYDLTSWENKIREEMSLEFESDEEEFSQTTLQEEDTDYVRFDEDILTIGCVGQPNVGKSSLMNAIKGKKNYSVSERLGHSKYFKTIFITDNVRLCDCPGLVFPSAVPKPIQILMGSFHIAELREPLSCIRFVAERLNLPKLLNISHPKRDETWSPCDICEAWAIKKRFTTKGARAVAARAGLHKAAKSILQMTLNGTICLSLAPPSFYSKKDFWKNHEDVAEVEKIQSVTADIKNTPESEDESSAEEEELSSNVNSQTDTLGSEFSIPLYNKFALLME